MHNHEGHYCSISLQWLEFPLPSATSLIETWQKHTCVGKGTKCNMFHPIGDISTTCHYHWILYILAECLVFPMGPVSRHDSLRQAGSWVMQAPTPELLLGWPCKKELQKNLDCSVCCTSITSFLNILLLGILVLSIHS